MWYTKLIFGLVVNTINIPYDNGANIQGSKNSPKDLLPYLDFLDIEKSIDIDVNNFVTNILNDGYYGVLEVLFDKKFFKGRTLFLNGDRNFITRDNVRFLSEKAFLKIENHRELITLRRNPNFVSR